MISEIICVGNEILSGDILNTNAQFISRGLKEIGIFVKYHTAVNDNTAELLAVLKHSVSRVDLIILTGGLGPTKDDLTKETIANFCNRKLIFDQQSFNIISNYFKRLNLAVSETNKKQAYFPESAIIFENKNGTAPGFAVEFEFENTNKIIIALPGPPNEMQPMFDNYVLKFLSKKTNNVIQTKIFRIFGIGEGVMAEKIQDLIGLENPIIAPYVNQTDIIVKLTAISDNKEETIKIIEKYMKK